MEPLNPYAAPQIAGAPRAMPEGSGPAWRSGSVMVVAAGASLPDRCVKCNNPAGGRRKHLRLSWHSPIAYVFLLVGLVFYIVAAVLMTKRLSITIGFCDNHVRQRRTAIALGWFGALAGIALLVLGLAMRPVNGFMILGGVLLCFVALVYSVLASRILWATRIRDNRAWLKGACSDYLADLPEYC
jgi:hypothetical protein